MALDIRLRQIISKSAGTYFIVSDNSQVAVIEGESRLRCIAGSFEQGPVNIVVKFAKGDKTSFQSVFGKPTRSQEKKGNFSHQVCLDAIEGGPIAVLNLRAYDDSVDKTAIWGVSPNSLLAPEEVIDLPYRALFNTNGFWVPKVKQMENLFASKNHVLQFGNTGVNDISVFVVKAKKSNVDLITAEGENTLANSKLEIDEYPALNFDTLVQDTFVDVYLFNNTFDGTSITNKYYGHLFDSNGNLDLSRIKELQDIREAGFVRTFTGTLIPGVVSETGDEISIDTVINQYYAEDGLIANLNEDAFETEIEDFLDLDLSTYYDLTTPTTPKFTGVSEFMLSHVAPQALTIANVSNAAPPATLPQENIVAITTTTNAALGVNQAEIFFESGVRVGDYLLNSFGVPVLIKEIELLDPEPTYTPMIVTIDGELMNNAGVIYKWNSPVNNSFIRSYNLTSYKVRPEQFIDGTPSRQKEILDMINDPGIIKGLRGLQGLRYFIDPFKSFVESGYKKQYGDLVTTLDESNRFVAAIINEPFVEDLQKSTNPLFKQFPQSIFDWSYLPDGGNKNFSTKLLTKFGIGSDKCYFFGPGDVIRGVTKPLSGKISNLFYAKTYQYDVLANESGYIDGITELESDIDDNERIYTEKFRYNAVINFNGGNTIYCNLTGQKERTAQQQIHNAELLIYIKQSLYDLSKSEAFKKGNYDDYLRTEVECADFMNALSLSGAIDPNPVVICNASNNTLELRKQKIKLVHIEYTPVDALEKVVFDLEIK